MEAAALIFMPVAQVVHPATQDDRERIGMQASSIRAGRARAA
jgi:hypothetical protein